VLLVVAVTGALYTFREEIESAARPEQCRDDRSADDRNGQGDERPLPVRSHG